MKLNNCAVLRYKLDGIQLVKTSNKVTVILIRPLIFTCNSGTDVNKLIIKNTSGTTLFNIFIYLSEPIYIKELFVGDKIELIVDNDKFKYVKYNIIINNQNNIIYKLI